MTVTKTTTTFVVKDGKKTSEKTEYYEVGAVEADDMLKKVREGGNEEELRMKLIKKSEWKEGGS